MPETRKPYPFLTLDPLTLNGTGARGATDFSPVSGLLSPPHSAVTKPKSPLSPLSPGFTRILHRARSLTSLGSKRSKRPDAGIAYRLPPELWIKVFMHIPLYLLPAVTLTCRSFNILAQPLLFSTISTHPAASPSLALRGPQTSKYRKRISERLEFFFSPRISPSIVECWISPPAPEEDAPTDDIIDTIFDSLSHLPNLKKLSCRYVRLTPRRLSVLQNLQLTTISLESCFGEIADFAAAPSVPLQEVTFKYPDAALRRGKACLLFLSPTHLEQLHATTTSILPILSQSPPFKKLRSLDIPIECITSDLLIPALLRCPVVDHLSLHTTDCIPRSLMESLPEGVLPLLSSYSGPHYFAAPFLRGRNAKTVDISVPCKPHGLAVSLVRLDRSLMSLSFLLEGVELPAPLLGTIHHSFPTLKKLAVGQPALASAEINAVLQAVPRHYTLSEITLHIQGRDKFNLWIPPDEAAADAVSCFSKCRAALLQTYPSLQVVRLMHGSQGARVMWRRSALSGLFVQVAA
ncbi:hypothetical protein DFH07DRAFT_795427 [Mycena maculata]|uniref:F-box domain-containing protein n=1 Tax=Mycena maculata TaxID=230809 RepID=A0AAD7NX49_9AGAR|nr:hypothetical protein DFH07DRAFT_795427 [Mycena maculata]